MLFWANQEVLPKFLKVPAKGLCSRELFRDINHFIGNVAAQDAGILRHSHPCAQLCGSVIFSCLEVWVCRIEYYFYVYIYIYL